MTADSTCTKAAGVRMPTDRTINPEWAVNSFPGRAKLAINRAPEAKSGAFSGIAAGSPYGLLVIWQSTQSPRPAWARQTAGRTFDCDRSEKGNGTRTNSPTEGETTPHPPLAGTNPPPALPQRERSLTGHCSGLIQHRHQRPAGAGDVDLTEQPDPTGIIYDCLNGLNHEVPPQ